MKLFKNCLFASVLMVFFKLFGYITAEWYIVLAPVWAFVTVFILLLLFCFIWAMISCAHDQIVNSVKDDE